MTLETVFYLGLEFWGGGGGGGGGEMYRIGGESKYTYTHSDTVSTKISIAKYSTVQYKNQ